MISAEKRKKNRLLRQRVRKRVDCGQGRRRNILNRLVQKGQFEGLIADESHGC